MPIDPTTAYERAHERKQQTTDALACLVEQDRAALHALAASVAGAITVLNDLAPLYPQLRPILEASAERQAVHAALADSRRAWQEANADFQNAASLLARSIDEDGEMER